MNPLTRTTLLLLMISASAFVSMGCSDDDTASVAPPVASQTSLRVIHSSYDAPAVDVWVDGQKAISNLAYGQSSGYATINAGSRNIKVVPAGATTPVVIEATLPVAQDKKYTVLAMDKLASITPVVAEDGVPGSKARIRFIHASPDAPAVDIKLNNGKGAVLFGNAAFKSVSTTIDVDAGTYNLAVTAAGQTKEVTILGNVVLENGKLYSVMARGTLNAADATPFEVRAFIDNGDGKAYADLMAATAMVKVVHASPDAPAVDLIVDNAKAGSNLSFPGNTGYLTVPAGTRNVKVNVAGSMTTVINADLLFDASKNYSVFAVDAVAKLGAIVLEDNLAAPASGKAHVRFVHLSPDAPAVDITTETGAVVFANRAFKQNTEFTPLDGGTYNLQVRLAGTSTKVLDLPNITLVAGKIYTVFARGFVAGTGAAALNAEIIVNK